MGIGFSQAAFLAKAKKNDVCFDHMLTVGHQTFYLSKKQSEQMTRYYQPKTDASLFSNNQYADMFFLEFLGAKKITSVDYSDYEGCDIIHDMNHPIDPMYHETFDALIDGGSLEHIFNLPVAIANYMKMVKKGGSVFIFTVANNHTGHGFYQFSPEIFFRTFQSDNGYEIREVVLEEHPFPGSELSINTNYFSVTDPAAAKKRVELVSRSPVMIMVHAVRTEIKPIFTSYPIQSDYQSIYEDKVNDASRHTINTSKTLVKGFLQKIINLLPMQYRNFIYGVRQLRNNSFSNRGFYKKWHPF
jgi:hypothetical protein